MFELGAKVRDRVSGFVGMVVVHTEYFHGCNRYIVEPTEIKDGKLLDRYYFDESRLEEARPATRTAALDVDEIPIKWPARAKSRIVLGSRVRDNVTGLEGVAVHRSYLLNGTIWIGIQPTVLHEGKPIEAFDYDEQRIEVLEERKPVVSAHSVATTGGPSTSVAPRDAVPRR